MSHGITDRDGMFTVREAAWHGLGTVLADHPTRAEAQAIAHPWEPVTEPIYRRIPEITPTGEMTERFEEIEGKNAVVRSDNGETLGVTNDTLGIVSNSELYDIAEALQGSASDVKFELIATLSSAAPTVWGGRARSLDGSATALSIGRVMVAHYNKGLRSSKIEL